METIYIKYDEIHKLTYKLYIQMVNDNWSPDIIVAIGTGGFIPARIIRTFLKKEILVVGIKRYSEQNEISKNPKKIQWIDEAEKKIKGKSILLIDEVDDTRLTLAYCLEELYKHNPKEIKVAVLHQKIKEKEGRFPDQLKSIYVGEHLENVWIRYPWEAIDIDKHNAGLPDKNS